MATLEAITMNISSRERKEKIQRYFNNEFINIYVIVAFNVLNIFNFFKKKISFSIFNQHNIFICIHKIVFINKK